MLVVVAEQVEELMDQVDLVVVEMEEQLLQMLMEVMEQPILEVVQEQLVYFLVEEDLLVVELAVLV